MTTYEKIDALLEMSLEIRAEIESRKTLIVKGAGFDPLATYEEQYIMALATHLPSEEAMKEVKRKLKLFDREMNVQV